MIPDTDVDAVVQKLYGEKKKIKGPETMPALIQGKKEGINSLLYT